ncbi:MAG: hypothetical protein WCG47_13735 [Dermatophilaceae bacterium]
MLGLAPAGDDDEAHGPLEAGSRRFGTPRDHREDQPQVVIALAVTRDGIPIRTVPRG